MNKGYTPIAKGYTKLTKMLYAKGVYYFERLGNCGATFSYFHDILLESYCTPSRTTDRNMPYY